MRSRIHHRILVTVSLIMATSVCLLFLLFGQTPGKSNRYIPPAAAPDLRATLAKAEAGDPAAAVVLGEIYSKGKQAPQSFQTAAVWYRKAADQGVAKAQRRLGMLYEMGLGVHRAFPEAAAWYLKAAEQGDIVAQYCLASMYARGRGIPSNSQEALKWYHRAAQLGDSLSRYNLAERYARGRDVSPDQVEAYKWYSLAADQGLIDAAQSRDRLKGKLTPEQLAEALSRIEQFNAQYGERPVPAGE